MTREAELIRALAEDLALEILTSYTGDDFKDADFTSLGDAAVYLEQHGSGPGPALQQLIVKSKSRQEVTCPGLTHLPSLASHRTGSPLLRLARTNLRMALLGRQQRHP